MTRLDSFFQMAISLQLNSSKSGYKYKAIRHLYCTGTSTRFNDLELYNKCSSWFYSYLFFWEKSIWDWIPWDFKAVNMPIFSTVTTKKNIQFKPPRRSSDPFIFEISEVYLIMFTAKREFEFSSKIAKPRHVPAGKSNTPHFCWSHPITFQRKYHEFW